MAPPLDSARHSASIKARAAELGFDACAVAAVEPVDPEDRLGTIFERFYSDRPATDAKRGKNSGLGLSISREIMLSHRGEIFAENLRDVQGSACGARFVVRLPLLVPAGGTIGRPAS